MALAGVLIGKLTEPLKSIPLPGGASDRFQINLGRRYRAVMAPLRVLLIGGCALLTLGILWDLRQALLAFQESQIIEAELDRVQQQDLGLIGEARREGIDLSEEALKRLRFEVDLANQLLKKRTFSWTKFLTELEQAVPPRLALSSVRLDQAGSTVRLTGTAMNLEDVTIFTVGLQDHSTFQDPVLAQHRVGSSGFVEFDIAVQYRRTELER